MQIQRKWGLDIQLKSRHLFTKFLPHRILEEDSIHSAAQRLNLKNIQENMKQLGSTLVAKNTTRIA